MEIRKSQLRDKLGWEVVRGFNSLPMASDVPSLRVKKTHRERTAQSVLSTLAPIAPLKHTDKVELWKAVHPSQDMANFKYRADTDIDVQRDMNYSSMPYMARSVYSENIFIVNLLGKAWSCVQGPHPNQ